MTMAKPFVLFFSKTFMKQDTLVDYVYKKPESDELRPKVSYFKLYEPWGLIIAAGAYLDEIDEEIEIAKANFKHK